jgi:phage-related holin
MEKIKGLGKEKTFIGSESQLQQEIDKTRKKLQDYNVELDSRNREGESVETKGWRSLQRKIEITTNYLDNLIKKQEEFNSVEKPLDFWETPEWKEKEERAKIEAEVEVDTEDVKKKISEPIKIEPKVDTAKVDEQVEEVKTKISKLRKDFTFDPTTPTGNQVYTKDYQALISQYEKESTRLENLLNKQEILDESGTDKTSQRYQMLQMNIRDTESAIEGLVSKMQQLQEAGGDVRIQLNTEELTAKINQTANEIRTKIGNINQSDLGKGQVHTEEYTALAKEIEKSGAALEKLYRQKIMFENAGGNTSSREFANLSVNIKLAEDKLQTLSDKMQNLKASGGDTQSSNGMQTLSENIQKASDFTSTLAKALRGTGLGNFASSIQKCSSNLSAMSAGLQQTAVSGEAAASGLTAMQTAIPVIGLILAAITLLTKAIKKVVTAIKNMAKKIGEGLKKVWTKVKDVTKSILSIGTASYNAQTLVGKLFNKIINSIKSRLFRQAITKAIEYAKEALNSLAQYSDSTGTAFNQNVSLLIADFKYLGRAIITAFEPIINAVTPILDFLINRLVDVLNIINQVLNALGGNNTWTKAKFVAENYASSLDSASSSAKELNKQIREWDKLNVITTQTGGSGGGSGSGGTSSGTPYETLPVGGLALQIAEYIKKLKEAFDTGDMDFFEDLGKSLGESLKGALDKIDWAKIKQKAKTAGETLASIINGFVSVKGLGKSIGKTIGEGINTALEFCFGFVDKADTRSWGRFLGDIIVSAIKTIDWGKYIKGMNTLGTKIAEFINGLAVDKNTLVSIGTALGQLIKGGVGFMWSFIKTIKWSELGTKIGEAISAVVASMNELDTDGKSGWTKLAESISGLASGLMDLLSAAIDALSDHNDEIQEAIIDFFMGLDWANMFEKKQKLKMKIKKALFKLLTNVILSLWALKVSIVLSFVVSLGKKISKIVQWVIKTGKKVTKKVSVTFKGVISSAFTKAKETYDKLKSEGVVKTISGLIGDLWETIQEKWDSIKDSDAYKTISGIIGEVWQTIQDKWDSIKDTNAYKTISGIVGGTWATLQTKWDSIKDSNAYKTIGGAIGQTWSTLQSKWESIKDSKAYKTIGGILGKTWSTLKTKWDSIKSSKVYKTIGGILSKTWTTIQSKWNGIKNGTATKTLKTAGSTALDVVKKKWDAFKTKTVELKLKFSAAAEDLKEWVNDNIISKINTQFKKVPILKNHTIPLLATGGFPEDGWFRASHGEMMGKFDNGKSVVANNNQITTGIANAVYKGNQENNALIKQQNTMLQQQNTLLNKILEKETGISYKDVFNAVRKGNTEYKLTNGQSAFV